jgi:hypothetical protein
MLAINDAIFLSGLATAAKCVDQNGENPAGTTYFGFVRKGGSWYIMKQVVSGNDISYLYAEGDSGYSTAWTGRTGLTYAIPI